jgi:hypothetical protein
VSPAYLLCVDMFWGRFFHLLTAPGCVCLAWAHAYALQYRHRQNNTGVEVYHDCHFACHTRFNVW